MAAQELRARGRKALSSRHGELNLGPVLVYPTGMLAILPLACANGMTIDFEKLAIGDLGPIGIGFSAIVIHSIRFRRPSYFDRVLILVLGALLGMVLGAAFQFRFKPSPLGLATIPILAGLAGWCRLRMKIGWLMRWEQNPSAWGLVLSRGDVSRPPIEPERGPKPAAPAPGSALADIEPVEDDLPIRTA